MGRISNNGRREYRAPLAARAMSTEALRLMAVHAHPDDESSSTGGVLARYADEGVRTVVVTCTNGELGDAPGGIKPGDDGHDEADVARIRLGVDLRSVVVDRPLTTHSRRLTPTLQHASHLRSPLHASVSSPKRRRAASGSTDC